jgi:2-phosphosulfolactate phosphatase
MPTLHIHFLPAHVPAEQLAGSVVIVIDLLRASSTICQALASGATCVMPFLEIDDARRAAEQFDRAAIVLGGERHGRIIDGFDLGNSPLEYSPVAVAGRPLLFTTTNGTPALDHAHLARRTLVGCALNRAAIVAAVASEPRVDILCAGTDGAITGEDILAAGAIADVLVGDSNENQWELNAEARGALDQWRALVALAEATGHDASAQFAIAMEQTPGGSNLLDIGHGIDLPACAELDILPIVPELNHATGEIRPA